MQKGNVAKDIIGGGFLDHKDLQDHLGKLEDAGFEVAGIEAENPADAPVYLNTNPEFSERVKQERKSGFPATLLNDRIREFANQTTPCAAVITAQGKSMALLGGQNNSFLFFDSHTHEPHGACLLVGGQDHQAVNEAASYITRFATGNVMQINPGEARGIFTKYKLEAPHIYQAVPAPEAVMEGGKW